MTTTMPVLALRLRLRAARAGAPACAALALTAAGLLAWTWVASQQRALALAEARQAVLPRQAAAPARPAPPAPSLDGFYAGLGERRRVEQQVATLFGLAERHGVEWSRADYKEAYDAAAGVYLYRVDLPLNGTDAAIWRFCQAAMVSMPYASLDEISFRRESIGDEAVEARVQMTLYLADRGGRQQ
jgi:hypothetical protein